MTTSRSSRGQSLSISTALTAIALCLGGCAAVPNLGPKPEVRSAPSVTRGLSPGGQAEFPKADWWSQFGDPQLAALIDEALRGSPTLAAADARARRAEGYSQAAGAALLPTASASGSAGWSKQSYNNGFPRQFVPQGWQQTGRASLDLSYEIDFFGKNRAALRAAHADQLAARIESEAARLALATSVAATWADLGRAGADQALARDALRLRQESADLVRRRVANGLDTRAELRQADAAVASAKAQLSSADEQIELIRNALAALLGAGPERGATIAPPDTVPHAVSIPANLPLELVARRADIAAAKARVEAAAARIKVARAAFYPNINLLALVGVQSLGLSNLTASGSDIGQATGSISLPIFEGGRLSGNYRIARADYDESVAQYDETLVRAVHEVADAIASQQAIESQAAAATEAVTAAREAYDLARRRYQGGLSAYVSVLLAEDSLLAARRQLAATEARSFSINVQLIRALGGGFSAQ